MLRRRPRVAAASALLLGALALPWIVAPSAVAVTPAVQVADGSTSFYDALLPTTLPVSGSGWQPGQTVAVSFDDGTGHPAVQPVTVAADGTFSAQVVPGASTCGQPRPSTSTLQVLTAGPSADGGQHSVTTPLTLVCPTYASTTEQHALPGALPYVESCLVDAATRVPVVSHGRPARQPLTLEGTATDASVAEVRRPLTVPDDGPACATYVPGPDESDLTWTTSLSLPSAQTSSAVLAPRAPGGPVFTVTPTCGVNSVPVFGGALYNADVQLTIHAEGLNPNARDFVLVADGASTHQVNDWQTYGQSNGGPVNLDYGGFTVTGTSFTVTHRLSDFQESNVSQAAADQYNAAHPQSGPFYVPQASPHQRETLPTGTAARPAIYTIFLYEEDPAVIRAHPDGAATAHAQPAGALRTATFQSPCDPPPTLTLSPPTLSGPSQGGVVTATGSGFTALQPITFGGSATPVDAAGLPISVTADDAGRLPATRLQLGRVACGRPVTVTASRASPDSNRTATQVVAFRCATAIIPASYPVTQEPITATVDLQGFDPGTTVTVSTPGTAAVQSTVVNSDGQATATLSALSPDCNPDTSPYPLLAVENPLPYSPTTASYRIRSPHAETSYRITGCDTAPTVIPSPQRFATASGTRTFHASISGLPVNGTTELKLVADGSSATLEDDMVTDDGSGTLSWTSKGYPDLPCGTYTLSATASTNNGATLPTGSAGFTVTCPTLLLSSTSLGQEDLPGILTVSGAGYDPSTLVSVSYPGATTPLTVLSDRTGAWSTEATVPVSAPCGAGSISGSEPGPSDGPVTAAAPLAVGCVDAGSLIATPSTFASTAGKRLLRVDASGLVPSVPATFILDGLPVSAAPTDLPSALGDLSGDLVLDAPTVGTHTLLLVQARPTLIAVPIRLFEEGKRLQPRVDVPGCDLDECHDPLRALTTTLTVTTPTVAADPGSFSRDAPPGSVTLAGTGWDPGSTVLVTFAGGSTATGLADATGAVRTDVDPSQLACGAAQPVKAKEAFGDGTTLSTLTPAVPPPNATSTMSVSCPDAPTATTTPATFATSTGGRPVTVDARGFRPGIVVTISTIPGPGETAVPLGSVTTDASGNLTLPATLPSQACGAHGVLLTPSTGYSAVAAYTVTCPVLQVAPATVTKGDATPDPQIVGTGYDPLTHVAVRLPGDDDDRIVVTTRADGSWSSTLPLKATDPCKVLSVTGTEIGVAVTPHPSASADVHITCLTLELSPGVVSDGEVVQVRGGGFTGGAPVALSWQLPEHSRPSDHVLQVVVPKADGTWHLSLLVMTGDVLGPRRLVATSTVDGVISAPLLVVPSAYQPGGQDTANPFQRGFVSRH